MNQRAPPLMCEYWVSDEKLRCWQRLPGIRPTSASRISNRTNSLTGTEVCQCPGTALASGKSLAGIPAANCHDNNKRVCAVPPGPQFLSMCRVNYSCRPQPQSNSSTTWIRSVCETMPTGVPLASTTSRRTSYSRKASAINGSGASAGML